MTTAHHADAHGSLSTGGADQEVALEGVGHGIPVEVPAVLAGEIGPLITDGPRERT